MLFRSSFGGSYPAITLRASSFQPRIMILHHPTLVQRQLRSIPIKHLLPASISSSQIVRFSNWHGPIATQQSKTSHSPFPIDQGIVARRSEQLQEDIAPQLEVNFIQPFTSCLLLFFCHRLRQPPSEPAQPSTNYLNRSDTADEQFINIFK